MRIKAFLFTVALLLTLAAGAAAQGFDYDTLSISTESSPNPVGTGSSGELIITINVPFGYSVTDAPGVFDIQILTDVAGVTFGELVKPEPDHVDEVGGHFEGSTKFRLPYAVAADAELGERSIELGFRLQACDQETGMCFMPTRPADVTRTATITVATESAATAGAVSTSDSAAQTGDGLVDLFNSALGGGNILFALLLAFAGGIISSLTPCVYPMIPITMAYVSGKSQGNKRNGFFISVVLVLGISITYSILGVVAGSVGGTFGSYLNHPVVQVVLLVIFFALGLSFLGVWEISLPSSLTNKVSQHKRGYAGALGIGLTLGIVAAPCVGPILIAMLLYIAEQGDLVLGFFFMFVYALGMGLLFIIVGTFSNAILPKGGKWMNWMKRAFAFLFFIMGVWYAQSTLESIFPDLSLYLYGVLFVLWGGAIGAFFRVEPDSNAWLIVGKSIGTIFLIIGLILVVMPIVSSQLGGISTNSGAVTTTNNEELVSWRTDYDAAMEDAIAEGKPVIVDFWATWCKECKRLDKETFNNPTVASELERFVRIKIDGTSEDDPYYQKIRKIYQDKGHMILGLPAVFLHDSRGNIMTVVNRYEDVATFLPKLEKVE